MIENQATQDFDRAKSKAFFSQVLNILRQQKTELLSFYDIKSLLRPKSEVYRGMKAINISDIVGSEGRYQDFNRTFLPRKEHLRDRWVRVNTAFLRDITLPPIRLYKIGDVYFVRDGNHRVSVARSQGVEAIDAEVTELSTMIAFDSSMTLNDLYKAVIDFEREELIKETGLDKIVDLNRIIFTAPGRYEEMLRHILGHKYYINQSEEEEIPFNTAALSWFHNIFEPIEKVILEKNTIHRFPGRTVADLYIWIVKHWDKLKRKYGQEFSLEAAAEWYSDEYGKNGFQRFFSGLKRIIKRIFRLYFF